jgi:hypothetical protein
MSTAAIARADDNDLLLLPVLQPERPKSCAMKISPDLRAALEYDEQTRESSSTPVSRRPSLTVPSEVPVAGLPPPPRPKSRASLHKVKSPPTSPTPLQESHTPPPPTPPSAPPPGPSGANPFINPTPRLSQLIVQASAAFSLSHGRSFSSPVNALVSAGSPRASLPVADSPESEKGEQTQQESPIQISSPESAEGSPGARDGRPGFQRHLRYLSSLQKVEKMLAKGKTRAVGKGTDGRGSAGSIRKRGRLDLCEPTSSVASSAPSSPISLGEREHYFLIFGFIVVVVVVVVGTVADGVLWSWQPPPGWPPVPRSRTGCADQSASASCQMQQTRRRACLDWLRDN